MNENHSKASENSSLKSKNHSKTVNFIFFVKLTEAQFVLLFQAAPLWASPMKFTLLEWFLLFLEWFSLT